jgi:hypothetical protein
MPSHGVPVICMRIYYMYWNTRYKEINHYVFQFCSCITFQFNAFPWRFLCYPFRYYREDVKSRGSCGLEMKSTGLGSDPVLKLREVVWPIENIKDGECKREAEPGQLVNTACCHLIFGQCFTTWTHVVSYGWFTAKRRITGCRALLLQWNKKGNNNIIKL